MDDAARECYSHRGRAIVHAEFDEQALNMGLHCLLRHTESTGNFLIAHPFGDEFQYFHFAR